MKRTLIIGLSGQVGAAMAEALGEAHCIGTACRSRARGADKFDLLDAARHPELCERLLDRHRPDVICIAGAKTHVDACEDDPEQAYLVNRDAPVVLASAAAARGARVVFFSSEYVFDGRNGPYVEEDPTAPLSVYGSSKRDAELGVLETAPDALVVRTTVVYGPEDAGRNFAYGVAARLAAGERMRVPGDQFSSVTYNRDLAAGVVGLLRAGERGIFHVAGPEVIDRVTFARRLASAAGLDPGRIEPVDTPSLGQRASRPLRGGLRVEKLRRALPSLELRSVEAAVADWLDRPRGKGWPR